MNDFGTLDLDEHAAFWARDDERAGVADERFEFAIGDEKFVARCRRARFVRDEKTDRDRESYFYEIGESGALLVADHRMLPPMRGTTVEIDLQNNHGFRPFRPREAARYGAKIYLDGTGQWFYRTQDKKGDVGFLSQSPFRLCNEWCATEFLQLPHAKFLDLCAQQWDAPGSEMRRSYQFDLLPLAERDAQALACENGDINELRRLMNLLARLIWSEANRLEFQLAYGYDNVLWLDIQTEQLFEADGDEDAERLNRLYRAWRTAIFRVVGPHYIGGASPLHIQDWLRQRRHPLHCVVQSPTHHELLEAQLQLREWARKNLSLAEQNELKLLEL